MERTGFCPAPDVVCLTSVALLAGRRRDAPLLQAARRLHALVDGPAVHLFLTTWGADSACALDILGDELDSVRLR